MSKYDSIRADIDELYDCCFDTAHKAFKIMNSIGIPKTDKELEMLVKCSSIFEESMKNINERYETLKKYADIKDFEDRQRILNN